MYRLWIVMLGDNVIVAASMVLKRMADAGRTTVPARSKFAAALRRGENMLILVVVE